MRKEKIAPMGWKPSLPKTAEEIETTCTCGEKKSPEFETCFECYEAQKRHHDYLFDNCLYEYLPEEDNQEPIGNEYLVPMTSKTYNEYYEMCKSELKKKEEKRKLQSEIERLQDIYESNRQDAYLERKLEELEIELIKIEEEEEKDAPPDWNFERDLMKLQAPKRLPYIAPEGYYIDELKEKLKRLKQKML